MMPSPAHIMTVNDFLAGDVDLCSPPEVFTLVSQALDDDTKGANDIAELIERDPSLSARMLKIVNSAFFGFPARIKSISHAVTILGDRDLRMLVMTTSVVERFADQPNSLLSMRDFWAHSLKVALCAKFLAARHPKKRQLSSVFISALLHDIGRLVMYTKAPDLARFAALTAKTERGTEIDAEIASFGFSHADLGGALLNRWKVPESLQHAAYFHHQPELADSDQDEVTLVYIANKLAHADFMSEESIHAHISPDDPVWLRIDLPYNVITPVLTDVTEQFELSYSLFFGR